MNNLIRWVGHVFKVNRGWLLFALAVYGVFGLVNRSHASHGSVSSYSCSYNDGSWQTCPPTYPAAATALHACQAHYSELTGQGWHHFAAYTWSCGVSSSPQPSANSTCYYMSLMNSTNSIGTEGYFCGITDGEEPPEESEACELLHDQTSGEGQDDMVLLNAAPGHWPSCIGGCSYGPNGPTVSTTFGGTTSTYADFGFTGGACSPPPESPPPAVPPTPPIEPVCKAAGSGQSYCITQDNKHCYTASTGRDICWDPGETGTKTDGAFAQKRGPGTTTPSTPPATASGDTFTASGTPVTSTTTTSTPATTTTTTTQNFTTVNGTQAGPTNQGQPSGTTQSGGTTNTGTTTGVGDCAGPVVCTGVSAIDCGLLIEAHKTACAVESLGVDMTPGEIGGLEGGEPGGNPASSEGTGTHVEEEFDTGDLDKTGFLSGGRSCPTLAPVMFYGVSIPMPFEVVCTWLSIGSYLILAFTGLLCLRIIRGVG